MKSYWNISEKFRTKKDLRLSIKNSYSNYHNFNLKSFLGSNSDNYDRFILRMFEMGESLNISNTICLWMCKNQLNSNIIYQQITNKKILNKNNTYNYMEDLIEHFIQWHTGLKIKKNKIYQYIESPKGEFGTILHSNNSNKPIKCKIRSPSYFNLQFLAKLTKGHYLSDLSALIGTIDIVFGEVDR